MDSTHNLNSALPVMEQVSLTPTSMKEAFIAWFSAGNAKKVSPQVALAHLDRISNYVIRKKISCSIWEISEPSVFLPIYLKFIDTIIERTSNVVFLYMKFLNEKPWKTSSSSSAVIVAHNELPEQPHSTKLDTENPVSIITMQEKAKEVSVLREQLPANSWSYISPSEYNQKRVTHIISSKFKSGYRTASSIDFERFKNYYADEYGENLKSDADGLDMLIKSIAVIFDDRAYMYDDETVEAVHAYLGQMNSPCVYIVTFFEKFSGELYTLGIFSVDMLKAFIEKNYVDIFCKRDYIYLQPDASPSSLIRQVFKEREIWSFDELFERLPCLKQDTIRAVLNGSDYHRIEAGVYTHIDNMDLPDSEGEKVIAFVSKRLQSKDYVIANELDLSHFEALNHHCTFSAIRDAVFNKFLANAYRKSGQVITRIDKKLRVLDILEQYCRDAETATFEELNTFEATFDPDGRTHSACLIAAYNVMVRVSADLFVAESMVSFDVERIDDAIALYCRDNFIPLKNVADFSLFPYAGYAWNLFLLESYVRKFSHVFKYDVRSANSVNIGVIVRKSFIYDEYDDILAFALAKSPLSLDNKKAVSEYLFDNGYIGWRNLGKSEGKILAAAKKFREGGAA